MDGDFERAGSPEGERRSLLHVGPEMDPRDETVGRPSSCVEPRSLQSIDDQASALDAREGVVGKKAVEACAAKGVRIGVVMTSGFGETGPAGRPCQGKAKTYMLAALPALISGVMRSDDVATSEEPVATAMYCLPLTENDTG